MGLRLVTPPTQEPLTLAEARLHLRVDMSDDDALLGPLIVAARQHVESFTHRALVTQTWALKLDAFPDDEIVLPMPPLVSVSSITYLDQSGVEQTWASDNYRVSYGSGPWASRACIEPEYGLYFPSTRDVDDAVTVQFVAGYGSPSAVPDAIKAAMKLLIGHWFASREAVVYGQTPSVVPAGVDALLWPFKAF